MSSPLHVLFVAPFGLGPKGTVRARVLPLARSLVSLGCRVTVLIPPWDTPSDSGRRWIDGGVRVVNVKTGGGAVAILPRMMWAIYRQNPDLIHIVKPRAHAGLVQWLLWQLRGAVASPLVLDIDDWEEAWSVVAGYPSLLARFLEWQERWGLTHADGITCASRWLEQTAAAMNPSTPRLYLPNGVGQPAPIPADKCPAPGAPPTVLLFSRFVEVSPGWMARFWRVLCASVADVRLRVGGRGLQPAHEEAMRAALENAGGCTVEWIGYVGADQLDTLYAETDCAIFPAADSPLNQAKCSVRLATTLLRGVPVVASAVGEQAHYGAEGAARLVPADATPEEFAAIVAQQLRQPQRGQQMAARARRRLLRDYSWDLLSRRLLDFYRTLGAI